MWTELLVVASVIAFAAYFCWYAFVGKTLQPITTEDADLMWRMHKKDTGCTGSRITDMLSYRGKVVGFRCECGYEFKQKRLIGQSVEKNPTPVELQDQSPETQELAFQTTEA